MQRRQFIAGVGSVAVGGATLVASGAYTRVDAHRRVDIEVEDDTEAFVGLTECPDSPNSAYTEVRDDQLTLLLNGDSVTDPDSRGVNSDSRSYFDRSFQVCNNETEALCVWIRDDPDWPIYADTGERRVDFYLGDDPDRSLVGQDNAVFLPVGDCRCLGVKTVTFGLAAGDQLLAALDNEVWIDKDSEVDCPEA